MNLIAESNFDGVYVPSPVERIRKQVADKPAAASRAERWKGRPVVILTSVGVRSAKIGRTR
ncbi:hypothetical protein [Mycobacterium sp.]|uniref:hypothetical protein n=1 Tax=Mycobacterium sp. TaxID=1785 RepID=UPI003340BEA3